MSKILVVRLEVGLLHRRRLRSYLREFQALHGVGAIRCVEHRGLLSSEFVVNVTGSPEFTRSFRNDLKAAFAEEMMEDE